MISTSLNRERIRLLFLWLRNRPKCFSIWSISRKFILKSWKDIVVFSFLDHCAMKHINIFNQPVNALSLKFSDARLEKQFWAQYIDKYFRQIQVAQLLAIVLYSLVAITEIVIFEVHVVFMFASLIVVDASLALGFLLTLFRKDFYQRTYRIFNLYYVLLVGFSLMLTGYFAPEAYRAVFYCTLLICLFFNYAVIRQDILKATISGLVILLVYILVVTISPDTYKEDLLIIIYLIATNLLGIVLAYMIEYDNKKYFLMMLRINADTLELSKINANLEKRVEERTRDLEIQKDRAEESDRLKTAFLENMSHEIRTPMNGILGFTHLLLKPGLTREEQEQYIQIVSKSGERMLRTVNNLLDISMIESGVIKPRKTLINLSELLKSCYDFFVAEAEEKGIQLLLDTSTIPDNMDYLTDRSFLETILSNLIKNSLKYTEKGFVKLGGSIKDPDLEFYVQDTGIGISHGDQEIIFDRFIKANEDDKQIYEGSGVGLSIAKSFVEMLNGRIWVVSQKEKGSTFYFSLPMNPL